MSIALYEAEVGGDVSLYNAKVGGDVSLLSAKVEGYVSLNYTKVGDDVALVDLVSSGSTRMSAFDMAVEGNLWVKVHAQDQFDFRHVAVGGSASFSGNRFDQVPDFRDAKFERPPEVADMEVPPPLVDYRPAKHRNKHGFWLQTASDEDDVAKYRKLKAMALSANDHDKDGEFFAYEMQAKRGMERGSETTAELLFNSLYYWLSNYGQSFKRPFYWMEGSLGFFALIYLFFDTQALPQWQAIGFALGHSFKNLVPLFTTLVRFGGRPEGYETNYDLAFTKLASGKDGTALVDGLLLVSYIQQFMGIILLFLLLLALRNKFRLK